MSGESDFTPAFAQRQGRKLTDDLMDYLPSSSTQSLIWSPPSFSTEWDFNDSERSPDLLFEQPRSRIGDYGVSYMVVVGKEGILRLFPMRTRCCRKWISGS
jgi:hypothetical protein